MAAKNNFNYETYEAMNRAAFVVVTAWGGHIGRNDTVGADGNVLSTEQAQLVHDAVALIRVDFSDDKYNALEISVTARSAYVAWGDNAPQGVREWLASAGEVTRKPKWVMKNQVLFRDVADMVTFLQGDADSDVHIMDSYSELWEAVNRDYIPASVQVTEKRDSKPRSRSRKSKGAVA